MTQDPFKLLRLPLVLECVMCASFKSGVFISGNPLCFLNIALAGLQSQVFCVLIFLVQDPQWGAQGEVWKVLK